MSTEHEHKFVAGGTVFSDGANPLPGSGATRRYYGTMFFCESCLHRQVESLGSLDESSYSTIRFGARPATENERQLLVPDYDRGYRYR